MFPQVYVSVFCWLNWLSFSFRAAVQRGVWENQQREESSCHERWELHPDRKVQWQSCPSECITWSWTDQEGGEGCECSSHGSFAALPSWCTWRRNPHLPWPITGTQPTCSCGLAWMSTYPGSTWTSGVTAQRSSCSGYVPHHRPFHIWKGGLSLLFQFV